MLHIQPDRRDPPWICLLQQSCAMPAPASLTRLIPTAPVPVPAQLSHLCLQQCQDTSCCSVTASLPSLSLPLLLQPWDPCAALPWHTPELQEQLEKVEVIKRAAEF